MDTRMVGSVVDIVRYTAGTDARETVIDGKTGAKIRINIDGTGDEDEGQSEPFYIEHGDNLYDAYNRREAAMILSNIRKGREFPDLPDAPKPKTTKKKATKKKARKKTTKKSSGVSSSK